MQRFLQIALGALALASAGAGCAALDWGREADSYQREEIRTRQQYEDATNELVNPQ